MYTVFGDTAVRKPTFFTRVEYSEFRRRLDQEPVEVSHSGYETILYDVDGDILGIIHAASIDETGRCHPTEYYLRRVEPQRTPIRLVA